MSTSSDLFGTMRSLRRAPGFFALATLLLAVGIAATLYVVSAIDAFVLRPLPFADAERLVHVARVTQGEPDEADEIAFSDYLELRDEVAALAHSAAYYEGTVNLGGLVEPVRVQGAFVGARLFSLLGTPAALGRAFDAADEEPGGPRVALLSHELWQRLFEGDPGVVGRGVRLNGEAATVVGVMPPGFQFPSRDEIWVPLRAPDAGASSETPDVEILARLPPGATTAEARAELDAALANLATRHSRAAQDERALVRPLARAFVDEETRRTLALMLVAVVLVLLIACADVANLLLVRGLGRQRETAVRAALGASRSRLLLSGLLEGAGVVVTASVLGLAASHWAGRETLKLLRAAEDMDIAPWIRIDLDAHTVVSTLAVAVVVTLAAALGPALAGSRPQLLAGLRISGRGTVGGRVGGVSRGLVVAQIALSVALVTCAVLAVRGVQALGNVPIGADSERILGARLGLFENSYPDVRSRLAFFERAERELLALPGVAAATVASSLPATFAESVSAEVEGGVGGDTTWRETNVGQVSPGYFETLQVRFVAGRAFGASDDADGEQVGIVNRRFTELFLGPGEALGRRVRLLREAAPPAEWIRIVGVVPDVDHDDLDDGVEPMLYVPLAQDVPRFAFLAVRSSGDPGALAPLLRRAVTAIDPDQPVYWLRTVAEWAAIETFDARFLASLFSSFALAGLLLAGTGVYGVLAFNVASRTSEIGLRRALGAVDGAIVRWIARRNFHDLALGLALGAGLAAALATPLVTLFYGVTPFDAGAWLAMPAVLVVATGLAAVVPTARALGVDPSVALREE